MSQLEDLVQQCTVKLSLPGRGGWGTGFFVAPEWILTCHHVVREANGNPVQVQWQKVELEAVVERSLPDPYDLALLRVTLPVGANPTCVWLDAEIRSRDPLYLFGYPDQDFPNGCPATFTCEGLTGDEPALIKFALGQVRPGMSGSPLLNQRTGKVCGIVKFTRDRSLDLGGGAVPTAVVFEQFPELVEQQRSFHQNDRRWTQRMEEAIASNHVPSFSKRTPLSLSTYDVETWVGRDELIRSLTQKLQDGCRVLAITGITGIGKTALAERLVVEVYRDDMPFHRLNFDDRGQGRDFLSGALTLLPKLGETVTTEDQKDHHTALRHLLQTLRQKTFLVQIDSLEMLLQGDDQTGWNAFTDPLWVDFFQQLLAGDTCQSQLLLTSQALSEELEEIGARYPRNWYRQDLYGLSEAEQLQLFEKYGLKPDGLSAEILKRFVEIYQGHPLVMQVIAKDILDKPFNGNVQQYWQRYKAEFNELDHHRQQKGSSPRALQLRVKQRIEQSLQRLPVDARQMLCRSSVYRRPVPEKFWLALVGELSEDQQWAALDVLKTYNLVEQELRTDGVLLIRQHNLVKGVTCRLLKAETEVWRSAEYLAAQTWLNSYESELNAPNLEKVRGFIEAFHHYCEAGYWTAAKEILIDRELGRQLQIWSYFQELLPLCKRILNKLDSSVDMACESRMGSAYWYLNDYSQSLQHYQQSLLIARQVNDQLGERHALTAVAGAYRALGDYQQSIEYYQQALIMAREMGDRIGEGVVLGGLGLFCHDLGNYVQSVEYHQQALTIAREMGDRRKEGFAIRGLGLAYDSLGNYGQAIEYYRQDLSIACEMGDQLGEGIAKLNSATILFKLEQYLDAQEFLQSSLEIFQTLKNSNAEAEVLLKLGALYYKKEQFGLARECCDRALTLAKKLGIPLVRECEELQTRLASNVTDEQQEG